MNGSFKLATIITSKHVHPIPIARERTWESKRSKQIQILKVENKRYITMVVSSTRNGF